MIYTNYIISDINTFIKQNKKPVIVILGPTASGKTDLAHKIALDLDSEIINADSRQIYKGLDILTAKPTKKQCSEVKYHMLSFLDIHQNYNAFDWRLKCITIIDNLHRYSKIPIICGGTMLYIDTLIKNFSPPNTKYNLDLRKQLEEEYNQYGSTYMYKKLLKLDPNTYVHQNNKYHLLRNLEICLQTGKPASAQKIYNKPIYDFLIFGINLNKKILQQRIYARSQYMFEKQSIKEFTDMIKKYDISILKKIIGAQELYNFITNKITKEEGINMLYTKTIQYAKRQMTWWKKNTNIKWISTI